MCGLTGFWRPDGVHPDAQHTVLRMAQRIAHRGPDDVGAWVDSEAGIALGHVRLSIIDTSAAGHQPMFSTDGRYVLLLNGEIYNHLELRRELGHWSWRGHSDTETLLGCFQSWGIEPTLRRAVGMFAIALWDRQERTLHLCRDRLGEKPLYFGWQDGTLLFGSELKALRAYPELKLQVDRHALTLFLRHSYIPAPYSIYLGIAKLEPGTLVSISGPHSSRVAQYWSLRETVHRGTADPLRCSDEEAVNLLEAQLQEAVKLQRVADVPLGAFLSGGIDSSVVVALMQAQATHPVKTFTIGFHDRSHDEAPFAKAVAKHLGTDHAELYVSPEDALSVIPSLPDLYDEPFGDSSQIPTYLVAKLARQQVTVSLSGDAGDELFGGYNRYFWSRRIWRASGWMPHAARRCLGGAVREIRTSSWDRMQGRFAGLMPGRFKVAMLGDKMHRLAERLADARDIDQLYFNLVSEYSKPSELVVGGVEPATVLRDRSSWPSVSPEERMMFLDAMTYLPDDILVKVDRAAMAVSLETRVPMLDHRVVELAWRLPLNVKIREGRGKWALRQVLHRYVPRALIERPKMGFGMPVAAWLRGPLRSWADHLLDESRLTREGMLRPEVIRRRWVEHRDGKRDWQQFLWNVLMFQAWFERYR